MSTVLGLIGAIIGFIIGIQSDSMTSLFIALFYGVIGLVIGNVIGFIIQYLARISRENKQRDENEKNQWSDNICYEYECIIRMCADLSLDFSPKSHYQNIINAKKNMRSNDERYKNSYVALKNEHISTLENKIAILLCSDPFDLIVESGVEAFENYQKGVEGVSYDNGLLGLKELSRFLYCLQIVRPDETTKKAYENVDRAVKYIQGTTLFCIEEKEYGNFAFVSEKEKKLGDLKMLEKYIKIFEDKNNLSRSLSLLSKDIIPDFVNISCCAMWYYAKETPFDIEKFKYLCSLFDRYTAIHDFVKVEVILSRVYAKKQIGGKNLAKQELDDIFDWIKKAKKNIGNKCIVMASGLAWMELYDMELQVLIKLVEMGVNLDSTAQKRFKFLENKIN